MGERGEAVLTSAIRLIVAHAAPPFHYDFMNELYKVAT